MCTAIETAFHKKAGQELARKLVYHIAKNEPFQNWDECIDAIVDELASISDNISKLPASSFLYAELLEKSRSHLSRSRYLVTLNDNEEFIHA